MDGPGDTVAATATFVESLGAATYAYAALPSGDDTLTVQLPGEVRVAAGDQLSLKLAPGKAHLFDADGAAFRRLA
ncbi:MAG: hypothetical protein B7Z42_14535 [Brevundimonas sp. 12-68-7]|nr:MAG: hypothetical protein B7Z42_14535 [Brevundimonas sp. 12-68-7]